MMVLASLFSTSQNDLRGDRKQALLRYAAVRYTSKNFEAAPQSVSAPQPTLRRRGKVCGDGAKSAESRKSFAASARSPRQRRELCGGSAKSAEDCFSNSANGISRIANGIATNVAALIKLIENL